MEVHRAKRLLKFVIAIGKWKIEHSKDLAVTYAFTIIQKQILSILAIG
jgi:hypothetical protein